MWHPQANLAPQVKAQRVAKEQWRELTVALLSHRLRRGFYVSEYTLWSQKPN